MGRVRDGAAREDWCWDLNPGMAAVLEGWDQAALGCSLLPCGLGSRTDLAGKERGGKDSCWWAVRRCHMGLD